MNYLFTTFLVFIFYSSQAQNTIIGLTAGYSYQLPLMDLQKKYSNNSNASLSLNAKLKSNWLIGVEGQFVFGSEYKDKELLGSMITSGGYIIGENESVQVPKLEGRGGSIFIEGGKIFPLSKENLNSGLCLKLGVGYSFYKVFVYIDDIVVSQLSDQYRAGYNRLEGGLSLSPYLGYVYYGQKRLFNASIGVQSNLSFTSFLTAWDYGTNSDLKGQSFTNMAFGPKATITVVLKTLKSGGEAKDGFFYN